MHAVIISHAAVIPINQVLYCKMARLPDVELTLIAPRRWRASVGGMTDFERHPDLQCEVIARDVWLNGHINLHAYKGLRASQLPPDAAVVYADEEPYSVAAYQAYRIARRLGCPFVFNSNQNLVKRYPPPLSWTERVMYRGAAAAIVPAPACAEALRAKGFERPIEVIGYGVDTDVFAPRDVSDLRARLGLKGFAVGYMGRLTPEKGVGDLVQACARLSGAGRSEFSLLIVGEGAERESLEAAARSSLGSPAAFTGSVPHSQAADYLNCMDVLVLPSRTTPHWREQFGRVIIEAMACGVPVVGSDSGHIPALIGETGGGLVFPEGDVDALAGRLGTLEADPSVASKLGQTGRTVVLERYSYARAASRTADALRVAAQCAGPKA